MRSPGPGWLVVLLLVVGSPRPAAAEPWPEAAAALRKAIGSERLRFALPPPAPVPPQLTRVVVVRGAGHAMDESLTLVAIEATEGGLAVTRLEVGRGPAPRGAGPDEGGPWRVTVSRGLAPKADPAIARARLLAGAEVSPPPPPPPSRGSLTKGLVLGGWTSSNDSFVHVRFEDEGAPPRDVTWAGYSGSGTLATELPPRLAASALFELVDRARLAGAPLDAAARALFVRLVRLEAPHLDEPYRWWVRERLVGAASVAGDAELVPLLTRYLDWAGKADSEQRTCALAVDALAVITGEDLRKDAHGRRLPLSAAAASYRARLVSAARRDGGAAPGP